MNFIIFNKRINLKLMLYLLLIFVEISKPSFFQSSKMVFIHSQI